MKRLITVSFLIPALIAGAQANAQDQKQTTTADTLILTSSTLPAAVKHNNTAYQLKKIVPGVKTFSLDFTEAALSALLQQLELSNGSHYEVEQLKTLIREQLKYQVNPK